METPTSEISVEITQRSSDCQNMAGTAVIRHYLIEGRVQGVGYRRFVQKTAEAFGLQGVVRNLQDGRVEVIADGSIDVIAKFGTELMQGPLHSNVETIKTTNLRSEQLPIEAAGAVNTGDFAILTDGGLPWF